MSDHHHRDDVPSGVAWSSVAGLAGAVLVLGLSAQVVHLKRVRADLLGDIQAATHAAVVGTVLPTVPVEVRKGTSAPLSSLCRPNRPLVVLITLQHGCPACEALAPAWAALRLDGRPRQMVAMYLDGVPATAAAANHGGGEVMTVSAAAVSVAGLAHIYTTPTVIATDNSCRIAALGSGLAGSASVLNEQGLR